MGGFDRHFSGVLETFEQLRASRAAKSIEAALEIIVPCLRQNRPSLACGNGGSAADALRISGEFVGRIRSEHGALNVICLSANVSVLTAWANDYDYDSVFERQVEAHGAAGGALLRLSTSGNSRNVIRALRAAKRMGLATIDLIGQGGGAMGALCDVLIDVPSQSTLRVQEMHLVVYHYLCEPIEAAFAGAR